MEWICGNGIAEIEGKKNCDNLIVAMPLPKQGKKIVTIVTMALPKMWGKKKWLPKSGEE